MVKIVNLFKAAGLWVGTIFLLYGTQDVDRTVAQAYGGYYMHKGVSYQKGGALAPTRSGTAHYATGSLTRDPTASLSPQLEQSPSPAFDVPGPSPGFFKTGGLGHGGGF